MMRAAGLLLALPTYCVATALLFGNPMQPIRLATSWSARLGIPYWQALAILCIAASALVFTKPVRSWLPDILTPSVFVILAVFLPTVIVGLYADRIRHRATSAFGADAVMEHSFFTSIRKAPADVQFFLHTAALKGCTPYAWSYRRQAFYDLHQNVAANVLPQRWISACGMTIGRR